jgi:hypothetical protein
MVATGATVTPLFRVSACGLAAPIQASEGKRAGAVSETIS